MNIYFQKKIWAPPAGARELLRRLRSIRRAFGPALADQAAGRAAVEIARTVLEYAEHRAKSGAGRSPTAANLTKDTGHTGERTSVEEVSPSISARHGEIP